MAIETDDTHDTASIAVESDLGLEEKGLYGGAALAVLGAFLPFGAAMGVEGIGLITLVLGIIAGGLAWYLDEVDQRMMAGMVAGGLIALIALYALTSMTGIGIYLTLIGGVVLLGAGFSGYRKL